MVAALGAGANRKSPRHSEWVTVKHDGRNVQTLVVYPESKDKRPVVLVIHEIFGLSDWAQELADELAAAGYIAVAPDLLSGMAPGGGRTKDFPEGVTEAISKLPSRPSDGRPERRSGLRSTKLPAANGKLLCRRILLGRRTVLPLRNQPRRSFRRVCFLRTAARRTTRWRASRRPSMVSTRERRAHWRHHSCDDRRDESGREDLRPCDL